LSALAVLARKGDGAAVDRATGDLGELLRGSFDTTGQHEIRLAEELEFLERYVGLQSHGDFDVVLDDGVELRLSRRYRSRLLS